MSTESSVLGLDLGPSSIGWALVDENANRIVATGVRVFPEGVDRETSGAEVPKNQQRRVARGMRRQTLRRSRRRAAMRNALTEAGFFTNREEVAEAVSSTDPYELRAAAVLRKLSLAELGRVFLHLAQRRGFLSNRKSDKTKKKEDSETLQKISDLQVSIDESGLPTLGSYLHSIRKDSKDNRLRSRHTSRHMFEHEFETIWKVQSQFYPTLLTEQLMYGRRGRLVYPRKPEALKTRSENSLLQEYGLHGVMFFQRHLYWPKSVIGRCELNPRERRCERGDRAAQEFRILVEVNNLRLMSGYGEAEPLSEDQRKKVLSLLAQKREVSFDDIRKKLGLLDDTRFNLEKGNRKKLLGHVTDVAMANKELFGPAWHKRPDAEKTAIVRTLLSDDEAAIRNAASHWGISDDAIEAALSVEFAEGYMSYGRSAIEALLPHLRAGLPLQTRDETPNALHAAGFLRADQRPTVTYSKLPKPPDITNPLVRQALFEVRKLVNAIIRKFGMPGRIHIELARDVKGTAIQRAQMTSDMRKREAERAEAAKELRAWGQSVSRDAINKYLIWREQGEVCLYSGRTISPGQLFAGDVDVDHILPWSRSLDDSLQNKAVCFRSENQAKGDRTPYEWLADLDPKRFDEILQRGRVLPFGKQQKLRRKNVELTDFVNRQLSDTWYITSKVREYLECLGCEILCTKGQLTAELRHHLELNNILREDALQIKSREDHRHHAIDAIVVALTDRRRLQALSRVVKSDRRVGATTELAPLLLPWETFREDAAAMLNDINVSHRARRKISGALHEETIYGPTHKPERKTSDIRPWAKTWIESPDAVVYTKPLAALTTAMLADIRDERVKELVLERLAQFGVSEGSKAKIPKEAFATPLRMYPRGGTPSDRSAVIKTVRLIKRDQTIQPIRGGKAWVKPGNTHHICIFEVIDPKGKMRREMISVTMLEAVRRLRAGEPLIQRKHPTDDAARFIMSLSKGEMILGKYKGEQRLMVYRTSASTQGQIYFADHIDARPSSTYEKLVASANTLIGRKVQVGLLGEIRWAND